MRYQAHTQIEKTAVRFAHGYGEKWINIGPKFSFNSYLFLTETLYELSNNKRLMGYMNYEIAAQQSLM